MIKYKKKNRREIVKKEIPFYFFLPKLSATLSAEARQFPAQWQHGLFSDKLHSQDILSPFQTPSESFIQGQCRHASLEASAALALILAWRSGVLVFQAPVWTFVVTFLWTWIDIAPVGTTSSGRIHSWSGNAPPCLPCLHLSSWAVNHNHICLEHYPCQPPVWHSSLFSAISTGSFWQKRLIIPLNKQIKCLQSKNAMGKLPPQMY